MGTPIGWQKGPSTASKFFEGQLRDRVYFELYLEQQHNDEPLFTDPVELEAIFYMPMPHSSRMKSGGAHAGRPHIDNLVKFLVEMMHNKVIADDKLICSFNAKKVYDKKPRTEFIIRELIYDKKDR